MMTEQRGSSNAKAKRLLQWEAGLVELARRVPPRAVGAGSGVSVSPGSGATRKRRIALWQTYKKRDWAPLNRLLTVPR